MTDPEPLRILSLGGGTQSCALALMSARGDVTLAAIAALILIALGKGWL
jgi:hypothetical protein